MADEPDGEIVAAVEIEAGEAVELAQELVAQALGIVEDDDGDDAALVDEGHERLLDVVDDLRAGARSQAELGGQQSRRLRRGSLPLAVLAQHTRSRRGSQPHRTPAPSA